MARRLNGDHFVLLDKKVKGLYEYQSYGVRYPGSTIVLSSHKYPDIPIAAISLTTKHKSEVHNQGHSAQALLVQRKDDLFQGMLNHAENDLGFVITNLTDFVENPYVDIDNFDDANKIGSLKIDILTEDLKPSERHQINFPTQAINEVNELRPSDSCHIRSDQRTGNYAMRLFGLTDSSNNTLTVQQSEIFGQSSGDPTKQATSVFVNVTASCHFPEMVALLTDAAWRPADVFVRKIHKDNGKQRPSPTIYYRDNSCGASGFDCASLQSFGTRALSSGEQCWSAMSDDDEDEELLRLENNFMALTSIPQTATKGIQRSSNNMMQSQAAHVVKSSEKVEVLSCTTNAQYNYDTVAPRMIMTFSIWEDMRICTLDLSLRSQIASSLLDDALNNDNKNMLESIAKIFIADNCVICLDKSPTLVIAQCGHQCFCQDCFSGMNNVDKCPLCRQFVSAVIPSTLLCAKQ